MIEIKEHTESGYQPLVAYEGWRVAMANYSERFSKEKLCRMERHLKTDEVFILLHGEATLLIGKERLQIPMEFGKVYNVKCGEWHALFMTPSSKVAIIENDNTCLGNTEYVDF